MIHLRKSFLPLLILLVAVTEVPAQYSRHRISLILNGGFETYYPDTSALGAWWLMPVQDAGRITETIPTRYIQSGIVHSGLYALQLLSATDTVFQQLNGIDEYSDSMFVGCALRLDPSAAIAHARMVLRDMSGRELCYYYGTESLVVPPAGDSTHAFLPIQTDAGAWNVSRFNVGGDWVKIFHQRPRPPVRLLLTGTDGTATWDDFDASTDIYSTSELTFLNLVLDEIKWIIDNWLAKGIDTDGPEHTTYMTKIFDAVTGNTLASSSSSTVSPVYSLMQSYLRFRSDSTYAGFVTRAAADYRRAVNPHTHLPDAWNGMTDTQAGGKSALNIYPLDVFSATADSTELATARETMTAALGFASSTGLPIPSSWLASSFNSKTGAPVEIPTDLHHVYTRWFDLVNALLEYEKYEHRSDFLDAAFASARLFITPGSLTFDTIHVSTLDFTPSWYGWDGLDPAFNDYFGYGLSGLSTLQDVTSFTDTVITKYLDLSMLQMAGVWIEALHRGGACASDQYRGWQMYLRSYIRDPFKYGWCRDLLRLNAMNVFKGAQGSFGVWNGSAFRRWHPVFNDSSEGALHGPAGNLARAAYAAWRTDGYSSDAFALIVTAFRSSQLQYKKAFGYIGTPEITAGDNPAGSELEYIESYVPVLDDIMRRSSQTLAAPMQLRPAQMAVLPERTVTLSWQPVNGTISYAVQIALDSAFLASVETYITLDHCWRLLTNLAPSTRFYWRVQSYNDKTTSPWSPIRSFVSGEGGIDQPQLVSPKDTSTGISLSPILLWNPVPGADWYEIEVSRSVSFIPLVESDSLVTTTLYPLSGLDRNSRYFWHTRAVRNADKGPWSSTWSFTTLGTTGIGELPSEQDGVSIVDGFPNPTSDHATITYRISTSGMRAKENIPVRVSLYDGLGKLVAHLRDAIQGNGLHHITIAFTKNPLSSLPSGMYFVRLNTPVGSAVRHIAVVR